MCDLPINVLLRLSVYQPKKTRKKEKNSIIANLVLVIFLYGYWLDSTRLLFVLSIRFTDLVVVRSSCYSKGYEIVMTTSLSSDVPVGYFSWAEYDIMAPVQPKTGSAIAAAFISNCGARNFRLQALIGLEDANIKIDSYGGCHRNRDGKGDFLVLYAKLFYFILLCAKFLNGVTGPVFFFTLSAA